MNPDHPIVFVDTVCPKPYDPHTLKSEGLGGTEATVVRVAEGLGEKHNVWVMQHKRTHLTMGKAVYKGLKSYMLEPSFEAKAWIVLRSPEVAINLRKRHPDAPVWLWMHDLVQPNMLAYVKILGELGVGILTVSDFHTLNFVQIVQQDKTVTQWPRLMRVYNPIDDRLVPDNTVVDKNKLVFFSSPHKGLPIALRHFEALRSVNPHFKLYVANPGYFSLGGISQEGVVDVGVLPHEQAIKHVREALCVFYPNHVFPETFGLVLAEANAVGTPVLTHALGAAREVLVDARQLVDTRDSKEVVSRVMAWRDGDRPEVKGQDAFRLANVLKSWENVLTIPSWGNKK